MAIVVKSSLFEQLHPDIYRQRYKTTKTPTLSRIIRLLIWFSIFTAILQSEPRILNKAGSLFDILEFIFAVLFTVEYVARLWSLSDDERWGQRHKQLAYILSPTSLTDILATAGLWLGVFMSGGTLVVALRLLRCVRLITDMQRSSSFTVFKRFGQAFKESWPIFKVGLMAFFVLLAIGSVALFFAEGKAQPEAFGSIPRAAWCVVMVFSTIGFGDVYPITFFGRLIVAFMAISTTGIAMMPGYILFSAFERITIKRQTCVSDMSVEQLEELIIKHKNN